ncbi:MAG: hypothetical protein ACI4OJ_12435, partial [Lachnospiraceae bacterium]
VEQGTENPRVTGSIPVLGTFLYPEISSGKRTADKTSGRDSSPCRRFCCAALFDDGIPNHPLQIHSIPLLTFSMIRDRKTLLL